MNGERIQDGQTADTSDQANTDTAAGSTGADTLAGGDADDNGGAGAEEPDADTANLIEDPADAPDTAETGGE